MKIVPFSFIRMGIRSGSVVDPWRIFHKSSIPCEEKKSNIPWIQKNPRKASKTFWDPIPANVQRELDYPDASAHSCRP
jgi:hypothetical protein